MTEGLLVVQDLHVHYPVRRDPWGRVTQSLRAVDGVSFSVPAATTLGVVGESGSGKSTLGRAILRLIEPTGGKVRFDGVDVGCASHAQLRAIRRHMQVIFQDPLGSLNPRMRIGDILCEPLHIHRVGPRSSRRATAVELLERVGLPAAFDRRFPHELSGGQRQRIGIARAIALRPKFIVCDEPLSALDVTVQRQTLNLLSDLKRELGLTFLFIAHNLAVVREFSDQVAVMYLGKIVEQSSATALFANPRHPYTMALLAAVLEPDPRRRAAGGAADSMVRGEPPDPMHPPSGCTYHPRCPFATELCRAKAPILRNTGGSTGQHLVSCHHFDTLERKVAAAAG